MYIVNLKRSAIINFDKCIGLKRSKNEIVAVLDQYYEDGPHLITLATYSTVDYAQKVFEDLIGGVQLPYTFMMPEEENGSK